MKFYYSVSDYIELFVSHESIRILDSYKVKTISEMDYIIATLRVKYPSCEVLKRSNNSLINEWRTHNLLYEWSIFKNRAKDLDLTVIPWWTNVMYLLLSPLYLHY